MDEKLEIQAKIAWLYYIGNVTQQDIAKQLHLSRPTVQRFLNLALENGVVQVKIDHAMGVCMDLAQRLQQRFNLSMCEVAPIEDATSGQIDKALALTSGRFLEQVLHRPHLTGVALGTGRAIRAMCHEVARLHLDDFKVVSLAGSVALDGSFNRYDASLSLAEKTDGKYFILSIPLLADDSVDRDYWYASRVYKRQLAGYAECQIAVVGMGWVGANCPLVADGHCTSDTANELLHHGAVGEILGWVFDAQGRVIDHAFNHCITSFTKDTLAQRPVIGLAGGAHKHAAILAALRGGWLNGLITDQRTAEYLMTHSD
jgi:DNA-binding transcriptional regulator LsrR (DeoR family)